MAQVDYEALDMCLWELLLRKQDPYKNRRATVAVVPYVEATGLEAKEIIRRRLRAMRWGRWLDRWMYRLGLLPSPKARIQAAWRAFLDPED